MRAAVNAKTVWIALEKPGTQGIVWATHSWRSVASQSTQLVELQIIIVEYFAQLPEQVFTGCTACTHATNIDEFDLDLSIFHVSNVSDELLVIGDIG